MAELSHLGHGEQPAERRGPRACPALEAYLGTVRVAVDGRARLADLERVAVHLRCKRRPGVALAADYVCDLCLGRGYSPAFCLFGPGRDA